MSNRGFTIHIKIDPTKESSFDRVERLDKIAHPVEVQHHVNRNKTKYTRKTKHRATHEE